MRINLYKDEKGELKLTYDHYEGSWKVKDTKTINLIF